MLPCMRPTISSRRLDAWLSRREREGWSWADLSRVSGIAVWKLRYRGRRQVDSRRPRAPRRKLLPVEVVEASFPAALEIVTPSGLRLVVPPAFDPGHLVRVLQVLGYSC